MRIRVLGELEVSRTGRDAVPVPETKVRILLVSLLLAEGRPVSADTLADHLWGDQMPANAEKVLRSNLSKLRSVLDQVEPDGRARVVRSSTGYQLRVDPEEVDAWRFRQLLNEASEFTAKERVQALTQALGLWRGPALRGFAQLPFAEAMATRLEEEQASTIEDRATARLGLGEHRRAADELEELARDHPLRESVHALRMQALYLSGRQAEALAVFERLRHQLAEELGADPGPETSALHQKILRQDRSLGNAPETASHRKTQDSQAESVRMNVPAPATALIGRQSDTEEVLSAVAVERLVTLTGPGGVGKTRLALEAAAKLGPVFPNGIWWVELGSLPTETGQEALIAEIIASTIGLWDTTAEAGSAGTIRRLNEALSSSQCFIVLDNCEHVIDSVSTLVRQLMAQAPKLHWLTTSREALSIAGEKIYEVSPLEVPPKLQGSGGAGEAPVAGAVRFFAERARAASPTFTLDERTRPLVEMICRTLDGLPLALELAANRVRTLGLEELTTRLDDRFGLLTAGSRGAPDRQQTLQAVIDWSWELLTAPERLVLRRLAVCPGEFTLAAAEAVCAGDGIGAHQVMEPLARLVGRSLVVAVAEAGGLRYRLLGTVAVYARQRMDEAGETNSVRDQHLGHYLDLAERGNDGLRGDDQIRWSTRLDTESANLRAAFDHAVASGRSDEALRLAVATTWHRWLGGRFGAAYRQLSRALQMPGGDAGIRARAVTEQTMLEVFLGVTDDPVGDADRAVDLFDADEDPVGLARAREQVGSFLVEVGELDAAEGHLSAALPVLTAHQYTWGIARTLASIAQLNQLRGRHAQAQADAQQARQLFGTLGNTWGQLRADSVLCHHAEVHGDYHEAVRIAEQALELSESLEIRGELCFWLSTLGRVLLLRGDRARDDYAEARRLHEQARTTAAEVGDTYGQCHAVLGLVTGARLDGRLERAAEHLKTWYELVGTRPEPMLHTLALVEQGYLAEANGDPSAALTAHNQALDLALRTGSPPTAAPTLEGLASASALTGDLKRASRLLGAAQAARDPQSDSPNTPKTSSHPDRRRAFGALQGLLTPEELARGFNEGHRSAAQGRYLEL